jgi:hypothetical protein
MSTVANVSGFTSQQFASGPSSSKAPASPASSSNANAAPTDVVDISPAGQLQTWEAGRIALNQGAGKLTSDQATQLYQQVSTIGAQIVADKQADGGTLSAQDKQAIKQSEIQLSTAIYSDVHNGATPPSTPPPTNDTQKRAVTQAGAIQLNLQAGNLTTGQAQQLMAQQATIDKQIASDEKANGGTLTQAQAQAINQLQNAADQQLAQMLNPSSGS